MEEAELESLEVALNLPKVGQARSRIVLHALVLKVVYTVVGHPARANNSSVLVDVEQADVEIMVAPRRLGPSSVGYWSSSRI